MKNKGFIVVATLHTGDIEEAEYTDLHVEDLDAGNNHKVAPDDDSTDIVHVWIADADKFLSFTRNEAKDFIEALQTIVDRYEITPEEWEARNA